MTTEQKNAIQAALQIFVSGFASQSQAASNLKGASEAMLTQILKGNWTQISEAMWRSIGKQVGAGKEPWKIVETRNYSSLKTLFNDAKENGNVHAIVGNSGSGKTAAAEDYARNTPNVYHIECAKYMKEKVFLQEILTKMGKDASGNVGQLMNAIVTALLRQDEPLLILDEADKLSNDVLYFFITFYNRLRDNCGIVLMATSYLQTLIERGLHKKGFAEIHSRLGRKFIALKPTSLNDVKEICKANGITIEPLHTKIYNECDGDLRRVAKSVHREKTTAKTEAA